MTRNEADEILSYIAQNLISPIAFDNRKASEVWLELSGKKFNQLCKFVYDLTREETKKMKCINCSWYWIDEGEKYYTCHCTEAEGDAPCECEEWEEEEEPELDEED